MTILHTVNKTSSHSALAQARAALGEGDALLFIEDGVTALISGSRQALALSKLAGEHPIYCLEADIAARGLQELIPEWARVINYHDFVILTEEHQQTLSWF